MVLQAHPGATQEHLEGVHDEAERHARGEHEQSGELDAAAAQGGHRRGLYPGRTRAANSAAGRVFSTSPGSPRRAAPS